MHGGGFTRDLEKHVRVSAAASECLNMDGRVGAALPVAGVVIKTSLKLAKPRRATPQRQEVFFCLLISTRLFPGWKKKSKLKSMFGERESREK